MINNNRSLHQLRAGTHTAEHSWTIFLAMVTQALLRGTPSPCTRPPARLAAWHLSIFFGHFVSSQEEKHPWEKWHITNFALRSKARLRPLSGAGGGGAALKAPAAPFEQQHLRSWRPSNYRGEGPGRKHLSFISHLLLNLTERYLASLVLQYLPGSLCLCA